MNVGIILASGIGKRMGLGKNKVFLRLKNKPLVYYALKSFEKCKDVEKILIVVRKEEIAIASQLAKKYKLRKIIAVIEGGTERQFSAFNAVNYLKNILQF